MANNGPNPKTQNQNHSTVMISKGCALNPAPLLDTWVFPKGEHIIIVSIEIKYESSVSVKNN